MHRCCNDIFKQRLDCFSYSLICRKGRRRNKPIIEIERNKEREREREEEEKREVIVQSRLGAAIAKANHHVGTATRWRGAAWCGVVRRGAAWCGVVRCGAVRCGAVRCGVARRGAARASRLVRTYEHARIRGTRLKGHVSNILPREFFLFN